MTHRAAYGIWSRLAAAALFLLATLTASAAARTIRIVAFGDSATYGYLVAREHAYPAQLEAALRNKGYDVAVKNAGVNGDTTRGALLRLDSAIDPGTDIVLVEFGTNDLRQGAPPGRMRAQLGEIVRTLQARRKEVLIIGLGRLDLSDVARSAHAPYAQWRLPPGKYRARDGQHYNAEGYSIVVSAMLPQIEALIGRRLDPR